MIDKPYNQHNLIYFDFLSYLKLNKLNDILDH